MTRKGKESTLGIWQPSVILCFVWLLFWTFFGSKNAKEQCLWKKAFKNKNKDKKKKQKKNRSLAEDFINNSTRLRDKTSPLGKPFRKYHHCGEIIYAHRLVARICIYDEQQFLYLPTRCKLNFLGICLNTLVNTLISTKLVFTVGNGNSQQYGELDSLRSQARWSGGICSLPNDQLVRRYVFNGDTLASCPQSYWFDNVRRKLITSSPVNRYLLVDCTIEITWLNCLVILFSRLFTWPWLT